MTVNYKLKHEQIKILRATTCMIKLINLCCDALR